MKRVEIINEITGEVPTVFYYENKSKLKKSDPRLYQISKGMLNGIYGMTATRLCRDEIILSDARDALLTMIEAVGYDNFLYCDTDSVFYKRTPDTEEALKQMNLNNEIRAWVLTVQKCG